MVVFAVAALLLGFLTYLAAPILVAPSLTIQQRKNLGDWYFNQSAKTLQEHVLAYLPLGQWSHGKLSQDELTQQLKYKANGEERRIEDVANRVYDYYGQKAGLADSRYPVIIDAALCHIAHTWQDKIDRDDHVKGGDSLPHPDRANDTDELLDPYLEVSSGYNIINPTWIKSLLGNSVTSDEPETKKELTKRRLRVYLSDAPVKEAGFLVAFLASAGGILFFDYAFLQGSGGGSLKTIPIGTITPTLEVLTI